MNDIAELLTRLDKVTGKPPQWQARCPAHMDKSPSLTIKQDENGKILIHCFAGCGAGDIMDAIGMSLSDLFPKDDGRKDWRKERDRKRTIDEVERIAFMKELSYLHKIQKLQEALAGQTRLRDELEKTGITNV